MERKRPTQDKVLLYMQFSGKAARKSILLKKTHLTKHSMNAALTRLRKRGLVRLLGHKYWQISDEGRRYVVKTNGESTNNNNYGDIRD